jgi:hypothetical protein
MVSGAFRQSIKLIDFGTAIDVRASGFRFPLTPGGSKGGAIEYMSPEIQRARTGEQLDYSKSDDFSAGAPMRSLDTDAHVHLTPPPQLLSGHGRQCAPAKLF